MDDDRGEAFEIYCSDIVSWPANGNDLEETLEVVKWAHLASNQAPTDYEI